MDNLNLIDSTFRRICEIANMYEFMIKELPSGGVDVCLFKDGLIKDDVFIWRSWKNKEQFLVGNQFDMSLFKFIYDAYRLYEYEFLRYECYANFINLCKILKSCECIEELTINMDLMGI
jgi:hypothetical protein